MELKGASEIQQSYVRKQEIEILHLEAGIPIPTYYHSFPDTQGIQGSPTDENVQSRQKSGKELPAPKSPHTNLNATVFKCQHKGSKTPKTLRNFSTLQWGSVGQTPATCTG